MTVGVSGGGALEDLLLIRVQAWCVGGWSTTPGGKGRSAGGAERGPSEAQARPKRPEGAGRVGGLAGRLDGGVRGGRSSCAGGVPGGTGDVLGDGLGMDWELAAQGGLGGFGMDWECTWDFVGMGCAGGILGDELGVYLVFPGNRLRRGSEGLGLESSCAYLGTGCAGALGIQGRSLGKACTSVLGVLKIVNLLLWTQKVVKMGLGGHFEDKMKAITVNLLLEDGKSVEAVILTKS